MAFNSLSSVINKQIIAAARIQASSQVRLGSAAALSLGFTKPLNSSKTIDSNVFVWGTNQIGRAHV